MKKIIRRQFTANSPQIKKEPGGSFFYARLFSRLTSCVKNDAAKNYSAAISSDEVTPGFFGAAAAMSPTAVGLAGVAAGRAGRTACTGGLISAVVKIEMFLPTATSFRFSEPTLMLATGLSAALTPPSSWNLSW